MSIKIITDSTCDIPSKESEKLDIRIVPLTVNFGEQSFQDGVDLTPTLFYKMLKTAKVMPTTSQVSVGAFVDAFTDPSITPEDDIIVITLSSKLSGTYQSACIAKNTVHNDKITIIDSQTITCGLGLLVEHMAKMRSLGCDAAEIVKQIEAVKHRVKVFAALATLKYLYKGGRLSGAGVVAGTVLGIKPIIEVKNGEIAVVNKARGSKAAYRWMGEQLKSMQITQNTSLYFLKADADKEVEEFMGELGRIYAVPSAKVHNISATVGTHIGNGGVGIAFIAKN